MESSTSGSSAKTPARSENILLFPDSAFLEEASPDGKALAALAPGAIWAQMSTIGVAGIDRVAAMVSGERPDVTLLDAPVSGSRDPAERGELIIFASGPGEARSRMEPLFGALGQRTIWVGGVGAGTRLKLVNNTWLAFATEAVAASVALARLLGLEAGTVVDALGGPLVSPWPAGRDEGFHRGVSELLEERAHDAAPPCPLCRSSPNSSRRVRMSCATCWLAAASRMSSTPPSPRTASRGCGGPGRTAQCSRPW